MTLTASIITATRRVSYLNRTIASVRQAGFQIQAVCRDGARKGSYQTLKRALSHMLRHRPDVDSCCVFEDDVIVSRNLAGWLHAGCPDGVASLYCPSIDHAGAGWQEVPLTLRNLRAAEASCGLVFSREAAERFVSESRWNKPMGAGLAVGRWCLESGTAYWRHVPSLVSHVGEVSAIDGREFSARRRERVFCHDVGLLPTASLPAISSAS